MVFLIKEHFERKWRVLRGNVNATLLNVLSYPNQEEKEVFLQRLQNVSKLLTPAGAPLLENQNLVYALLDLAEAGSHLTPDPHSANAGPATKSFMRNSGKLWKCYGMKFFRYSSEYKLLSLNVRNVHRWCIFWGAVFLYYGKALLLDLVEGLSTQCPCGMTSAPWVLEFVVQV